MLYSTPHPRYWMLQALSGNASKILQALGIICFNITEFQTISDFSPVFCLKKNWFTRHGSFRFIDKSSDPSRECHNTIPALKVLLFIIISKLFVLQSNIPCFNKYSSRRAIKSLLFPVMLKPLSCNSFFNSTT